MIIPGFIVSWITFPGVIVHELAHKIFCHLTGTRVVQVCYFRLGNPAGYVIHEQPTSVWKHILIGIGPFFLNTILGLVLGLMALALKHAMHQENFAFGLLVWLAISIAMHSFPSSGDAKSIWRAVWERQSPILAKIVASPLVAVIFIGAIGSIFWLDLAYGFLIVFGVPEFFHLH